MWDERDAETKRGMGKMVTGMMVVVFGMPGVVEYVCPDGMVGVALVGERGIHEWHPSQCRPVSVADAARMSLRRIGR